MKFCFVLPRIGKNIAGGAEGLCRELGEHIAARGHEVTFFATCAEDNRTWENVLPVGSGTENGIPVERFPVDARDLTVWVPLQIALHQGKRLSIEEEILWLQQSVNSTALYQAIESRQQEFDYFIFAPYLFGTSICGPHIIPKKSLLLPCLHDESYAYTKIVASAFQKASGCIFNAQAERNLAERLYGPCRGGVVGMGFYEQELAQEKYFTDSKPYLLYLGRKETGKNAHILLDYFVEGKDSGALPEQLQMAVVGPGDFSDLERPKYLGRADILDIGKVTEEEKKSLTRNALALVQPSQNESFSIVIMESWLQKTPVMVNAYCDVTREHVVESNGGLYFGSAQEFIEVTKELLANETMRKGLGENGFSYVRKTYDWQAVVDRFEEALKNVEGNAADGRSVSQTTN